MTSRIILSQIKRTCALRTAIVPQISNQAIKRSLMTKSHMWANRMKPQRFGSLLGSQQGKCNRSYSQGHVYSRVLSPFNVYSD